MFTIPKLVFELNEIIQIRSIVDFCLPGLYCLYCLYPAQAPTATQPKSMSWTKKALGTLVSGNIIVFDL